MRFWYSLNIDDEKDQNLQLESFWIIRESPSPFENRIMPRVFIRSISRSTSSSVACGISSIKIDNSDNPKSLISRINKVHVFFNKLSL